MKTVYHTALTLLAERIQYGEDYRHSHFRNTAMLYLSMGKMMQDSKETWDQRSAFASDSGDSKNHTVPCQDRDLDEV